MEHNALIPGKLWQSAPGHAPRVVLVLAVQDDNQPAQILTGYAGKVKPGSVVIAEAIDGDWKRLGTVESLPIAKFLAAGSGYVPFERRGRPITYMPGSAPPVSEREKRSRETLHRAGGRRRIFSLTKNAVDALDYIGVATEKASGLRPDETAIVNRVLVEEEMRLRKKLGEPK